MIGLPTLHLFGLVGTFAAGALVSGLAVSSFKDAELYRLKSAAAQQQAMAMQRMQAMAPAANQTADAIKKFADIPEDQREQMTNAMQGLSGYGMPT